MTQSASTATAAELTQDEQIVDFSIESRCGRVVVDFGRPLEQLELSPAQAIAFANELLTRAHVARVQGTLLEHAF